MSEPVHVETLEGFDPYGDPELRRVEDGGLALVFNFMPPSWVPEGEYADLGRCRDFGAQLEQAIGSRVIWDDREVFLIPEPEDDTPARIRAFLDRFRREHEPGRHSRGRGWLLGLAALATFWCGFAGPFLFCLATGLHLAVGLLTPLVLAIGAIAMIEEAGSPQARRWSRALLGGFVAGMAGQLVFTLSGGWSFGS